MQKPLVHIALFAFLIASIAAGQHSPIYLNANDLSIATGTPSLVRISEMGASPHN